MSTHNILTAYNSLKHSDYPVPTHCLKCNSTTFRLGQGVGHTTVDKVFHAYCKPCIKAWVELNKTCPACSTQLINAAIYFRGEAPSENAVVAVKPVKALGVKPTSVDDIAIHVLNKKSSVS